MAKRIDITEENYSTLKPTGERILVKRDKGEERTESGVWYAKEQNRQTGTVIALGDAEMFEKETIVSKLAQKFTLLRKDMSRLVSLC